MNLEEKIGKKIEKARIESGYTQIQLAEELKNKYGFDKVSNTTVSNWESNTNKPHIEIVAALCQILNKPANYFIKENIKFANANGILDSNGLNDDEIKEIQRQIDFIKSLKNKN